MPLTSILGGFLLPAPPLHTSTNGLTFSTSMIIDAASEKAAMIFQIPKTGTVTALGFGTRTVTTGATVDVRLETVDDTTGHPTGTLFAANTNGSQIIGNGDDNAWFETTLTASASVTKGQVVAVVIANPAASFGSMQISRLVSDVGIIPYTAVFTTVWTSSNQAPVVALKYNDGSYALPLGCFPFSAVTEAGFNSGSTPDEQGLYFQIPFPVRVSGFWFIGELDADATFKLYDLDGSTVLASLAADASIRGANNTGWSLYQFDTTVSLSKDTNYRLTCLPSGGGNVILNYFDVNAAAIMDAMPGGQLFHYTSRTDAGAWSQTTTRRPLLGLLIDQAHDGTGGDIHLAQSITHMMVAPWSAAGYRG